MLSVPPLVLPACGLQIAQHISTSRVNSTTIELLCQNYHLLMKDSRPSYPDRLQSHLNLVKEFSQEMSVHFRSLLRLGTAVLVIKLTR